MVFSDYSVLKKRVRRLTFWPTIEPCEIISGTEYGQGNADLGVEDFILLFEALRSHGSMRFNQVDYATISGTFTNSPKDILGLAKIFYAMKADSYVIGEMYDHEVDHEDNIERLTEYYDENCGFYFWWD